MGNGTAPPWTPAAGELVAERFDLERQIARGGMGSIWRAHHVRLDTPVALKFIDGSLVDSDFLRDRFQREARAAARLRSRHVVQILDYGVWQKLPYIAMELLEGETLADRLERECRLEPNETLSLVKGIVHALSKAAELNIVHRDLKPENLFIVSERGHDFVKVLDFGVAKLRDPNLLDSNGNTKTGVVVGTPYYMSPEQSDGTKAVDHRSDLWSLAVIVYECLTGELPFYSEAFGNLVLKINSGPIPVPSDERGDLPRAFDDWWARAASRDPRERFQTADDLFEGLYDALVDPRQSLSSYPFLVDGRLGEEPGALTWSGPHSSARPAGSLPPDDLPPESLPAAPPSHRGTFGGHASSRPPIEGKPSRRRAVLGVLMGLGLATAAGVGWVATRTEGPPLPAHAGALRPPEDLHPSSLVSEATQAPAPSDETRADDEETQVERDDAADKPAPLPSPRARPPAKPAAPRPIPRPAPGRDETGERFPSGI